MSNFNRSQYMKQKHQLAKAQKQVYESRFDKIANYKDFLSKDNPLQRSIVTYQVSYQISYIGEFDTIKTKWETLEVTTYEQNKKEIKKKIMNMLLDSRGKLTGDMFNAGAQQVISTNTKIKVTPMIYPRGAEQKRVKFRELSEIEDVLSNKYVVKGVDKMKFTNKKGREGEMKLDFRHF